MTLLSSKTTLFYKIFLPVFWIVFHLAFLFIVMTTPETHIADYPVFLWKAGTIGFILLGTFFIYIYVWPLKRVEYTNQAIIVTNYFKAFRYTISSIDHIRSKDWFFFSTITILLKDQGQFGRKIHFIGSNQRMKSFMNKYPDLFSY